MDRVARSAAVTAKAKALAVRYDGSGRFTVASGSTVGQTYSVTATYTDRDAGNWSCTCPWAEHGGRYCAHVQAADAWLTRWERREARQAVAR